MNNMLEARYLNKFVHHWKEQDADAVFVRMADQIPEDLRAGLINRAYQDFIMETHLKNHDQLVGHCNAITAVRASRFDLAEQQWKHAARFYVAKLYIEAAAIADKEQQDAQQRADQDKDWPRKYIQRHFHYGEGEDLSV